MSDLCAEQCIQDMLRDPLIRLVMAADHVTDEAMVALLRRVACAGTQRRTPRPTTGRREALRVVAGGEPAAGGPIG